MPSASANTLTNMIPQLFAAMDIVSRELIGFIPAVTRDSRVDRVAINQSVNVPVVGTITPVTITPANVSPDTGAMAPGNVAITISNQYAAPVAWGGDEQVVATEAGLYDSVQTQRFAQGFRAIANLVEADLAALHAKCSRGYGTYNVQPFGTAADLSDMAQAIKILDDNGAPADRHAVFGSSAIANIRGKQSVLFKVNEAGTSDMLRRGIIGDIMGVAVHNSAQVKSAVASGGATNATIGTAAYAVGATALTLASAGANAIAAGDMFTIATDANIYVCTSSTATNVGAGGVVTIAQPGLRQAITGSTSPAITMIGTTDRNMVFSRSAIVLATRTPYMPKEGDQAADVRDIVDPVSGLAFQIALYKQYRQVHVEIGLAWGCQMVAPRHSMILMG